MEFEVAKKEIDDAFALENPNIDLFTRALQQADYSCYCADKYNLPMEKRQAAIAVFDEARDNYSKYVSRFEEMIRSKFGFNTTESRLLREHLEVKSVRAIMY